MKAKFFVLFILSTITIIISNSICKSAEFLISENRMFGFEDISDPTSQFDSLIIKNISFERYRELGAPFLTYTRVKYEAKFNEIQNITMYYLEGDQISPDARQDPYLFVLFNTKDSSLYHFGGDTYRFSLVFRNYLKTQIDNDNNIIKLLEFYLNTISPDDPYYILKKPADLILAYSGYLSYDFGDTIYFPNIETQSSPKFMDEYIRPLLLVREGGRIRAEFYTWDQSYGDLEYWRFEISSEFIQIVERRLVLTQIGPYNMRFSRQ